MEIENRTIALLIDSDNISKQYLKILIDEVSKYGNITYKRIYGDFTTPKLASWRPLLLEFAVEPIQQYLLVKKNNKESFNITDSAMIIDAMDILYTGKVDCICLATSDSDFTKLAMRYRNQNFVVIGAGKKKTPQAFRAACHRFILMDALLAETKQQENEEKQKRAKNKPAKEEKPKAEQKAEETEDGNVPTPLHKIIEISKSIISEGADADGWMLMSNFVSELYREENSFNPKLYGYRNSKPTSFFKSLKAGGKPVFTLEKKNSVDKIRIASQ